MKGIATVSFVAFRFALLIIFWGYAKISIIFLGIPDMLGIFLG